MNQRLSLDAWDSLPESRRAPIREWMWEHGYGNEEGRRRLDVEMIVDATALLHWLSEHLDGVGLSVADDLWICAWDETDYDNETINQYETNGPTPVDALWAAVVRVTEERA